MEIGLQSIGRQPMSGLHYMMNCFRLAIYVGTLDWLKAISSFLIDVKFNDSLFHCESQIES